MTIRGLSIFTWTQGKLYLREPIATFFTIFFAPLMLVLFGLMYGSSARPSTAKRHLADLRTRSGLTTEQLIYAGRAPGRLVVPSLEPS